MEEYFGIQKTNFDLLEYDSLHKDDSILYWIKKTDTGKVWKTFVGNEWEIYDYTIFDAELNETNIKVGEWEVISIYEKRQKHSFSRTFFNIADKNKMSVTFQYPPKWHTDIMFQMEENAIQSVIKFLNEVKNFDCWNSVLLYYENKKLKKEIATLQDKLKLNEK